jgi:hypothetical protein
MLKKTGSLLICTAIIVAPARAATFVIRSDQAGHEATIMIPLGAVSNLSSNAAEALSGYANPQIEAMRLSGDVRIDVKGAKEPIQIRADKVLLELIPDETPDHRKSLWPFSSAAMKTRSSAVSAGDDHTQIFTGNVVFDIKTLSGPLQIRADRVTYRSNAGSKI